MISSDLKISVITVCFNSDSTIGHTIRSVNEQTYSNIEHVFIDGGSTDRTIDIIEAECRLSNVVISEPDNGIYDAMNKGVAHCSGSIICFLNSDDIFYDSSVLTDVAVSFEKTGGSFIYGNIKLIQPSGKIARDWIVGNQSFFPRILQPQIPHPGTFVSAASLKKLDGPFDPRMKIAADLKVQLQLNGTQDFRPIYLNRYVVQMRIGGASTGSLRGQWIGFVESIRAWNAVHRRFGLFFAVQKVVRKFVQVRL